MSMSDGDDENNNRIVNKEKYYYRHYDRSGDWLVEPERDAFVRAQLERAYRDKRDGKSQRTSEVY